MDDQPPTSPATPPSPPAEAANSPAPPTQQQVPTAAPVNSQPSGTKLPSHRLKWLLGVVILVIIVAGAVIALKHVSHSTTNGATAVKKDIPLFTFGIDTGGEVPQYPLRYNYSNTDILVAAQLFEGLTGFQNQTKVVPLLATSWTTPNDTTWVFNLRQGVKFHSGRTMTAQDVKYTLDYDIAHQNDPADTALPFLVEDISQVTVNSTYQVTITTTGPDPVLLAQLGLVGIIDSQAKLGDYDAGTGPYIVKPGTTPTSLSIDLVASNNYWGGHVYTREVKMNLVNSSDQLATDTANNQYDLAGEFTGSQLASIKHYKAINVPDQGVNYVAVDTERAGSPLQSLAARQAVAYALNIPAIMKAGGLQGQQANQIVPVQLPGHNPSIATTPYDPAKAKQLLATVANASAPITFACPTVDAPQTQAMINELKAVGFNVSLVTVSDFDTFITNGLAGDYDLYTAGDTSATVDGLDILTDLLINNKDYDNPQIDSLVTQAGSTLNTAARINEMQQIATIVAQEKPIIPLYTQDRAYALTNSSYVINSDLPDLGTSTYFWKTYQD